MIYNVGDVVGMGTDALDVEDGFFERPPLPGDATATAKWTFTI